MDEDEKDDNEHNSTLKERELHFSNDKIPLCILSFNLFWFFKRQLALTLLPSSGSQPRMEEYTTLFRVFTVVHSTATRIDQGEHACPRLTF